MKFGYPDRAGWQLITIAIVAIFLPVNQVTAQLHQPAFRQAPAPYVNNEAVLWTPSEAGKPAPTTYFNAPPQPNQYFYPAGNELPPVPSATPPAMSAALQTAQRPVYLPLPGGYSQPEPAIQPAQGLTNEPPPAIYPPLQNYPAPLTESVPTGPPQTYYVESGYQWTLLPNDLLWTSYVGGPREPRLASSIVHLEGTGWLWELEAGGRVGIARYGTTTGQQLEGWQIDLWGGAFPRLNLKENVEVDAVDFKVGIPLTWSRGPFQMKFEWYHISSHLGDEFLLRPGNAGFPRIDYLRDSLVLGAGYFVNPDMRLYFEADYAYNTNGGAMPWHFQFGLDYNPIEVTPFNRPAPFFAINGHIREELNYSGGLNLVAGIQWRGQETNHVFRTGLHYYNGQSLQYSFINEYEQFLGWGMWLDF